MKYPVKLPGSTSDALLWADPETIEPAALNQLRNIADLPWLAKLRVMPDVHYGKGATVGSVIAMKNAVSPSAVGVDIGCGMTAVKTTLSLNDLPDDLGPLRAAIEAVVPVGFDAHNEQAPLEDTPIIGGARQILFDRFQHLNAPVEDKLTRAVASCGTLGGGNHFIEVCSDATGNIWLMLHSGSRGIGKAIADYHINEAKNLDQNLGLPDRDLAVFLSNTDEMAAYLHDLEWAQRYAHVSRTVMMHLVKRAVSGLFPQVVFESNISCHHNYVAQETYADVGDVIVTRKGAIRAGDGEYGLIPGSMGTGSYVVRGLGNDLSLQSASHGAGRVMSRTKAKKAFTVTDLETQTFGVECRKDDGVLDEIPGAYKNIADVIEAQAAGPDPLVEVVERLTTLVCVKG